MSGCERRVLAETSLGRIELCACGTVHIAFGRMAFRLPAAAVRALRDLLDEALATDPAGAPLAHPARRLSKSLH